MTATAGIIHTVLTLVLFAGLLGWLVFVSIKTADDPARMVFKWVITIPIVAYMIWVVAPLVARGGYSGAFGGIPMAAICGLALAIIWRRSIAEIVANPLSHLYDGGNVPPEPRPAYSTAQARQKSGKYLEAIAEVRKQLEKFPTDFEGHMLLAQIQAEDLKDLPGAELTIQRLCSQPGHAPANITFALLSLADWQLQVAQDREAAQRALEQILTLLPDSEFALTAAQRIAHLTSPEMLRERNEEKKYALAEGIQNVGLAKNLKSLQPIEKDPSQAALDYVQHLEEHPLDSEAREKLAILYADHYHRLDLATDQLEQMIQQPNQPAKLVTRWLNLLADLQIRCGADYDTIRSSLERIVERGPNLAPAENARNRISLLKLELKGKQKTDSVKMGTYEQNIGLKRGTRP
ncbi:MAG TPA: hypothetical protein VG146_10205 [Verrucomicrobiae bacterium]|nr:hypothetical protein [Verrucomicrobiae bacterium]